MVPRRTMLRNPYRDETNTCITRCHTMYVICYSKYPMILVFMAGRFLRFRLLQDTFQVGVNDERHSFLPAVVLEAQPLVILTRQPDRAVIHLPAIHSVSL